jgi:hypothetical protein
MQSKRWKQAGTKANQNGGWNSLKHAIDSQIEECEATTSASFWHSLAFQV